MALSVIEAIARWSAGATDFSPLARGRVAHAILDTVGCIFAGMDDPATSMTRRAYANNNDAGAPVVGGGRTSPGSAALVNATSAHCLDFDDTFRPLMGHASAVLVPALIAAAEQTGASGRRLVDAYLIGLEAQAAIGLGMNPGHYAAGWHATSTIGTIGAAAGTARILGLDEGGIARAMSLAVSMAAGVKGQFGTPAKPLHAGLAARNAVEAAMLAAAGMTGRLDVIELGFGFQKLYAGGGEPWVEILSKLGAPHSIESIGLAPKRHPCCASTHNTLDMLFDLKAAHGFKAGDVASVDTLVGSINKNNLVYETPVNEMQARFSMNYCVAVALKSDRVRLADFTQAAVDASETRRLLPLTRMRAYTAEEERAEPERAHKVAVSLTGGAVLHAERGMERGTLADPFDDMDRRAKFMDCVDGRVTPSAAAELYDRLSRIDDEPNLGFLSSAFLRPAPQIQQRRAATL